MESRIFYKNLRKLRKAKHISQEEIGKMLGMKRSTYAHMESYSKVVKITPLMKKVIWEEFGFTVDELFNETLIRNNDIKIAPPEAELPKTNIEELDEILLLLNKATEKIKGMKNNSNS